MQTRDKVKGLHNCQEKSKTLLFRALIKREILTSREVLYNEACMYNQPDLSNRTKPNKKPIKPNRTPIVRLGWAIEQNQTPIFAVSSIFEPSNIIEQNRTKSN